MEKRKENVVEEENKKIEPKTQEKKKKVHRRILVLIVILVTLLAGIIHFRGQYLEFLEIGEQYISTFWQNLKFIGITMACLFGIIFMIMLYTNSRIKAGLRKFFEQEKREMPKLPNKSIRDRKSVV